MTNIMTINMTINVKNNDNYVKNNDKTIRHIRHSQYDIDNQLNYNYIDDIFTTFYRIHHT